MLLACSSKQAFWLRSKKQQGSFVFCVAFFFFVRGGGGEVGPSQKQLEQPSGGAALRLVKKTWGGGGPKTFADHVKPVGPRPPNSPVTAITAQLCCLSEQKGTPGPQHFPLRFQHEVTLEAAARTPPAKDESGATRGVLATIRGGGVAFVYLLLSNCFPFFLGGEGGGRSPLDSPRLPGLLRGLARMPRPVSAKLAGARRLQLLLSCEQRKSPAPKSFGQHIFEGGSVLKKRSRVLQVLWSTDSVEAWEAKVLQCFPSLQRTSQLPHDPHVPAAGAASAHVAAHFGIGASEGGAANTAFSRLGALVILVA